jgi:acyl-CoA synthetase (AMP-forming)/AMP-acid ligase II
METILDAVARHATQRGSARAYWTPRRTWTFAELWDAAGCVATGLERQGIGRGDRVACLTKHTAECVALVLGACRLGAVCMPVNWRLAPSEIAYIVKDGGARFMMADRAM